MYKHWDEYRTLNNRAMATLEKLIEKYEKEWTKYGMGSAISYSELLTDLKACVGEPVHDASALPIPDVSIPVCHICDAPFYYNNINKQFEKECDC